MASLETTRDHWAFDKPLYTQRQGEENIPAWFLKQVRWNIAKGGYITESDLLPGRVVKVEYSFDHLCWAETCWVPSTEEWEIFRPAFQDLECDIHINELMAEEVWQISEGEDMHTSHTCTPAPLETSQVTNNASEPNAIIIHKAPWLREQELAELAESLHISAHPTMSTINAMQMQMVLAGIIDPVSGQMMTKDEVAQYRAELQTKRTLWEDYHQEGPFQAMDFQWGHWEVVAEEGHQEGVYQEEDPDIKMEEPDNLQTSWWEIHQKCSQEYNQKLSLSLLLGGSMLALTLPTPSSSMHIRGVCYSSCTFKGLLYLNGHKQWATGCNARSHNKGLTPTTYGCGTAHFSHSADNMQTYYNKRKHKQLLWGDSRWIPRIQIGILPNLKNLFAMQGITSTILSPLAISPMAFHKSYMRKFIDLTTLQCSKNGGLQY